MLNTPKRATDSSPARHRPRRMQGKVGSVQLITRSLPSQAWAASDSWQPGTAPNWTEIARPGLSPASQQAAYKRPPAVRRWVGLGPPHGALGRCCL